MTFAPRDSLKTNGVSASMPPIPVTRLGIEARIGLLADTHCHEPDAGDLPASVLDAFRNADLVIHLGDMGDAAVLDRLATVAAVVATRGRDDPREDHRIAPNSRVVEAGGLVIGAVFDLAAAGLGLVEGDRLSFPAGLPDELLRRVFDRRVDVVAFGATHRDVIAHHGGVLLVNPGSATLPAPRGGAARRTAAVLEVRAGIATAEIVFV
jgi:putative phosphoesterase